MEPILRAADVAAAIRETLAGRSTKSQLGDWAHRAMLADDTGSTSYDPKHATEIGASLYKLTFMTEGPDYEIEDTQLRTMAERLERLVMDQ